VTPPRFVLGIDLGQAHDYTALVVLERVGTELHARHIERLRLGTSYPEQVARIAALVPSPELARDVLVAVDGTGVGRAVTDLLRTALRPFRTPLVAITITGGAAASRVGSRWSVPKRDLIASAQVALQAKRLKIAASLPTAQTLMDELSAYRVTISDDGRDTYGNGREAPNDDLVLALAIAVYAANRRARRTQITHVGLDPSLQRAMSKAHREGSIFR
jgi:phage FluMu gp28-like protein